MARLLTWFNDDRAASPIIWAVFINYLRRVQTALFEKGGNLLKSQFIVIWLYTNCMYEVEEIVGKKWIRNKLHYRVKWRGYSLQESTWEKEGNLKTVRDLIDAFLLKEDQKPSHNAFLKTEHGALEESAQLKEREVFDSGDIFDGNRDFASSKDSQIGSNKFQSNELRQLKFNFNQAELVEALKQTNQSQKLAKGISKNQNIRKKAKKMGLNKKQPKKLQIHSLEERKSPIASLKGCNDSAQFQKQALNSEQAELNQTPEFGRCSKTRNNDETEPQMLLGQQTTSPQNQPSKKRLSQRKRQQTVPQTCSQPQPTLHNQSAMLHPLFQTRDESKSAYTLSSTSNDKNSQAQKQDHKRRNLKIRLLETQEPRSQIRDYLVQSEEGVLKVYSSIELLVAYPLEFIIYLQGRNYRKK